MDNEIYETGQSVCERAINAKLLEHALEQAIANLETWRKDKNYKLNNTEILLAVTKGQLEVETQKMSPYLPGATLISESMITSLNQDIQRWRIQVFLYTDSGSVMDAILSWLSK